MKGTASSRAILAIVGGIMTVMALGSGISPLMNMLGVAEQSTDLDKLEDVEEAVREECNQAINDNYEYSRQFNIEFKSLDEMEVSESEDSLEATFESDESLWQSEKFDCQLEIDNEDGIITEGEWSIDVKGVDSSGENHIVSISPDQQ